MAQLDSALRLFIFILDLLRYNYFTRPWCKGSTLRLGRRGAVQIGRVRLKKDCFMGTKKRSVFCTYCGNSFLRRTSQVNEAKKQGWKTFCSLKCQKAYRTKRKRMRCITCSKPISVQNSVFIKSISKKFFCSHSCAAKHSNIGRKHKRSTKNKIKQTLRRINNIEGLLSKNKSCPVCNKKFYSGIKTCCSVRCSQILRVGLLPMNKKELIEYIKQYFVVEQTAPSSKRVKHRVVKAAIKYFGSWNKCMQALKIPPNVQWIRKNKIICEDGHVAESISEKIIDNWLTRKRIKHERFKPYPEGRFLCDFYLPDMCLWLEFFGLAGQNKEYDKKILHKRMLAKKHGLVLAEVYPKDLYPVFNMELVLNRYC